MERANLFSVAAASLLLIASLGVLRFELAHGGGSAYRVSWVVTERAGPSIDGRLAAGDSGTRPLQVALENVTRATFVLSWTDDVGDPDTFNVTVTAPSGELRAAQGSASPLTIAFDGLATPPPDAHLLATSAEAARSRAGGEPSRAAVGAWTVTVKLVAAPGRTVAGVEVQPDGANDWQLTSSFSQYEPMISRG